MLFDDYSYELYNKHVLINPNVEEQLENDQIDEDDSDVEEELGFMPPGSDNQDDIDKKQVPLSNQLLEASVHESYKHSQLDIQTEDEVAAQ